MIRNTIEIVRENLNKIIGDYKEFKNYFYEVLYEWTDYYELNDLNNNIDNIIIDLMVRLDDSIRERKRKVYYKKTEDMVNDIYYAIIIKPILEAYRSYNLLVNSKECITYLLKEDPTLFTSLYIAKKKGYKLEDLDSEILANLLYKEKQEEEYNKIYIKLYGILVEFCKHYVINIHDYIIESLYNIKLAEQ